MNLPALTRAALLCAGVFAALPAHAQRARDPLLLSGRPAPREGCATSRLPSALPAVDALADSAALARAVDAFASEYRLRDGKMFVVYSVAFAADGSVARVAPIDYLLPQGHEPELTATVRGLVRAQRPGKPWSVRLRIDPGAQPALRVGRSEVCPARSTTRFELTTQALDPNSQSPQPVRVRIAVREDGNIGGIQLLRSSGNRELDGWIERSLMGRRFYPELVDGVGVAVDHEEEVRIRYRR